jgi:radical SAM-linked protein
VQRLRLRYRKTGPARFIGTRELTTVLVRAARRAALPVAFSHGHHPMPKLSFGAALPVGCSSEDEYVDVDLTERLAPTELVGRLAAELPQGLEPLAAAELPRTAPSIDADTIGVVWEVDVDTLDRPPAPEALADAVARFTDAASFPVVKRTPKGERTVDARRLVARLEASGPTQLRLELAQGSDGSVKPSLVVAALLGIPAAEQPLLRVHKRATRFRPPVDPPAAATG